MRRLVESLKMAFIKQTANEARVDAVARTASKERERARDAISDLLNEMKLGEKKNDQEGLD
jgi:hypothetical protein